MYVYYPRSDMKGSSSKCVPWKERSSFEIESADPPMTPCSSSYLYLYLYL